MLWRTLLPTILLALATGAPLAGQNEGDISDIIARDRKSNGELIRQLSARSIVFTRLNELAEEYDLFIGVDKFETGERAKNQPGAYQGSYRWSYLTGSDRQLLEQYAEAFVKGWRKLPVDFIKKTGVRGVVFVKNLKFAGITVGGGFGFEEGILLINVIGPFPGADYVEHIYFHEFFHVLQNRYHTFIDYKEWVKLHGSKEPYYPGGSMKMIRDHKNEPEYFFSEHPRKGFVNNYARTEKYHDVTETYCYLMITPFYERAAEWMKSDPVLKAKFAYLKKALGRLYPGFDDSYFQKIHEAAK